MHTPENVLILTRTVQVQREKFLLMVCLFTSVLGVFEPVGWQGAKSPSQNNQTAHVGHFQC